LLTAHPVTWRDVWVGAVVAACGWQALQLVGTYYLTNRLRGATQVYGLFGLVLGLIGWLFLLATMVVLAMEINAVRSRRLFPRSLLTVFLDDVDLTESDERAYSSYAQAEQFKASQRVEVTFDGEPARLEHSVVEHSVVERPGVERSVVEQPVVEQPVVERQLEPD
jgi:membrane protein